jgi:hypothetical protein
MASFLEDVISGHENAMYGETGTSGLYHNSPTQTNYNINATSDLANRISQGVGSIPMAGPYLGGMTDLAMPALALGASPFYDTSQAIGKAKEKYGSSYGMVDDTEIPGGPTMGQLGTELNNQNILSSMFERSLGAATPLASKLSFNTPNFDFMGSAQASEMPVGPMSNLERDFPGMSTGDIIDSMNNRAFIGRQISPMAKPQIASPRTVIDPNRIPGRIQEAVEPSTRFRDASNMAEYLQGNPQIMDNIQNTIGSGIDKFKSGLGSIKDFAMDKGRMGRNLLGSAGAMALGLPGIVGSGAMALMGGMGNAFEDRQLSGDGTTVDEYGRSYNASDLNKMNARGGYYTEAARSSRRRTNRINDMLARKAKGKRISAANLARLQAQEQAQEQARLTATRQMARDNRDNNTGGYQAGYSGSFMDGSGTAAEMGSSAMGGIIGHGGTGGRPAQSGLASMFTRRR